MQIPLGCAQLFAELTTEIQTAQPSRASKILYEAGNLMLLAGEEQSAYQAFCYLLNSEFALKESSYLINQLEAILLSLCHSLRIPYPKTPCQEEMNLQELDATVQENEQRYRDILYIDRFMVSPKANTWSEEYISSLIGEQELKPEESEFNWFLQDAYRAKYLYEINYT